ncbi:MAG: VWA domain-containing protein, partial [Sporichthyaceae bacterium]|nr:VWA domain-containing protein [Sporichthyaceae bacterium]
MARALRLWSAVSTPLRVLMLCDVTSSMGTYVRTAEGTVTRSALLAQAVPAGLGLLSPQSRVGMWTFAAESQEVVAIDILTATHRDEIERALLTVRRQGINRAKLHQSLLAAYAAMRDGYNPAGPNMIMVFTDAGDGDNTSAAMARFSDDLQRLADPTKAIRVVLIGVSVAGDDEPHLRDLADVVGGDYYSLGEPAELAPIVLTGLLGL